jgi:hypothetical protein
MIRPKDDDRVVEAKVVGIVHDVYGQWTKNVGQR